MSSDPAHPAESRASRAREDIDLLRDLRAARWRTRRRALLAVALNVALAGAFVVFPWWRGRARGADARAGFAAFAACLLGGRAAPAPGLALPRGAWDRFAFLALDDSRRAQSWPSRCVSLVDGISPEGDPPTLMLPWARSAEQELDESLPRLRDAMRKLVRARRAGPIDHVPSDVPNAIENVTAKLAYLATEAGSPPDLEAPALDDRGFRALTAATRPTRVFLGYRGDTSLAMRMAERGALHLVLWDRTRTGTASVTERGPRERRVLATPPAWGPIRDGGARTWLVRISRAEHCGDQCDRRATGLAALDVVSGRVSPVVWLRASVVGRPDRSIVVRGEEARVIAGDGERLSLVVLDVASGERRATHELVGFGRPENARERSAHPPGALAMVGDATRTVIVDAGRFAPPAPREGEAANDETTSASAGTTPADASTGVASPTSTIAQPAVLARGPRIAILDARGMRALPAIDPLEGDEAWTLACRHGARTWVALGTTRAVRMATLDDADDRWTIGAATRLGTTDGMRLDDVDGDDQRLRCDARGATLAMRRDPEGGLAAIVCAGEATACVTKTIEAAANGIEWDLVRTGRGHVVAWSGSRSGAQIRVQPLDGSLAPLHGPIAPTVCWEPERGLCGRPRLLVHGGSVLLATALSASVVVLRSDDGGVGWSGLEGR